MKKTVAILFGGCSSEYDVSLVSATSVIKNIKKDKYNLLMIGITRDGDFYLYNGDVDNIEKDEWLNEVIYNVKMDELEVNSDELEVVEKE